MDDFVNVINHAEIMDDVLMIALQKNTNDIPNGNLQILVCTYLTLNPILYALFNANIRFKIRHSLRIDFISL